MPHDLSLSVLRTKTDISQSPSGVFLASQARSENLFTGQLYSTVLGSLLCKSFIDEMKYVVCFLFLVDP